MTNSKMTQKIALTYALDNLPDAPADVREKLESMIVQIDKRNASPKKLTKAQIENAEVRDVVVEFIHENAPTGFTCSDLIKQVPVLDGKNTQYVSALMRVAIENGRVEKFIDKRRTYFRAV